MFDRGTSIELLAGEIHDEDKLFQLTREGDSKHWLEHDRHVLPGGLEDLPPGLYYPPLPLPSTGPNSMVTMLSV